MQEYRMQGSMTSSIITVIQFSYHFLLSFSVDHSFKINRPFLFISSLRSQYYSELIDENAKLMVYSDRVVIVLV